MPDPVVTPEPATGPTTDCQHGDQARKYRLIPGEDFSADTVAALLDDASAAEDTIAADVAAGVLLPVERDDAPTRYRLATPPPAPDDDIVPPEDERERAAVLRVLHHLVAHLLGVEQRLSSDTYRSPYLDELTGVPTFADDISAMSWFIAESRTVFPAQRLADAMGERVLVQHFGEVSWTASMLAVPLRDVLAVQTLAAEVGQRRGDLVAATALARRSWVLLQLGLLSAAAEAAEAAVDLAEEYKDNQVRRIALKAVGDTQRAHGRHRDALESYELAVDFTLATAGLAQDGVTAILPFAVIGELWNGIARIYLEQNSLTEARTAALIAIAHLSLEPRGYRELAEAHVTLARAMLADSPFKAVKAITVLDAAHALLTPAVEPALLAQVTLALGDAKFAGGAWESASRHYRTAIDLFNQAGRDQQAQEVRERLSVLTAAATSPASE